MIKQQFGYDVAVIVRNANDMKKIAKNNPFIARPGTDISKLYVTFLNNPPVSSLINNFTNNSEGSDEWIIKDTEIYLYCPNGCGQTKLTNNLFERKLKVSDTTRNWKTVQPSQIWHTMEMSNKVAA